MIDILYDFFLYPFIEYGFLQRALLACAALSLSCGPVGIMLVLRRMSLMGDALSHAVLPGAAVGYLVAGLSLPAMGIGGVVAGLLVALLAGVVSRFTILREDASFAGFYLISLALGVLIISLRGSSVDLVHVLFGTILAVDSLSLLTISSITFVSLGTFILIYRPLIIECFDPTFLRSIGVPGIRYHVIFLILVVLNLVSAFQALGTLMALGLLLLPAIAARFWARDIIVLCSIATVFALLASYCGLLLSYYWAWPSGPAIILVAGFMYSFSLLFGRYGSMVRQDSKSGGY